MKNYPNFALFPPIKFQRLRKSQEQNLRGQRSDAGAAEAGCHQQRKPVRGAGRRGALLLAGADHHGAVRGRRAVSEEYVRLNPSPN